MKHNTYEKTIDENGNEVMILIESKTLPDRPKIDKTQKEIIKDLQDEIKDLKQELKTIKGQIALNGN